MFGWAGRVGGVLLVDDQVLDILADLLQPALVGQGHLLHTPKIRRTEDLLCTKRDSSPNLHEGPRNHLMLRNTAYLKRF